MLYFLGQLGESLTAFNVFRYVTFRTAGAVVTALFFVFMFGPGMIALLRLKQGRGQPIREDGPAGHLLTKKGTPTMGGLMILSGAVLSTLLWSNLANGYVWVVLFVTIGFGAIGFYDDYLKVKRMSHKGFGGRQRLLIEAIIGLIACYAISRLSEPAYATSLLFPFVKGLAWNMGYFFIVLGGFVIMAAGNSVNLTDGLDGLAIVPVMVAAACFALIAYLVGSVTFSDYLLLNYTPGTAELSVVCGALIGAGLGFLWFNAPPAQIFMGDTGSLALGGALGTIAVATKHEIVLAIIGGLFVLETVSVIVQVASFRLTGKRVFRMAPIHHHFEALGWTESQVVIRFWIISFVLALIGLSSLKLR
ncbi:MAG: phospho-N-acetylmuramoyl-pentapeptide-transferase [Devosia sp.]|uniref:phospho-N-acetylmuramoyl-pentapeptide- transferase n=1 Tax=Devosia sp. TaxID=1871048 RepID=UPI002630CEFA|nr:phospho-N-acetylmuramoyl-pentapeptide-transferase [Devosia sp.]MDB5536939.1 phospho-N-acetylmuramoyl-pentapeptide-transferase [Devosia sp.]MDB5585426.1 phospho-N-acetylmuramoyl-pentapeptide-transferase [Devosia sp.]